jgi:hypothetical protein
LTPGRYDLVFECTSFGEGRKVSRVRTKHREAMNVNPLRGSRTDPDEGETRSIRRTTTRRSGVGSAGDPPAGPLSHALRGPAAVLLFAGEPTALRPRPAASRDQVDNQPDQVQEENHHHPERPVHPPTGGIPVHPDQKCDPDSEKPGDDDQLWQPQIAVDRR